MQGPGHMYETLGVRLYVFERVSVMITRDGGNTFAMADIPWR